MNAMITGAPKPSTPSRYILKLNGCEDKIHGYDDGEWMEPKSDDRYLPYIQGNEIETLEEIDQLTEING